MSPPLGGAPALSGAGVGHHSTRSDWRRGRPRAHRGRCGIVLPVEKWIVIVLVKPIPVVAVGASVGCGENGKKGPKHPLRRGQALLREDRVTERR